MPETERINGQVLVDDARVALDEWRRQQGLGPSLLDDEEIICEAVIGYAHQLRKSIRAAQPEADRAPGEVDAAARMRDAIYAEAPMASPELISRVVRAALDALRSEQGQSRDDTVTLDRAANAMAAWLLEEVGERTHEALCELHPDVWRDVAEVAIRAGRGEFDTRPARFGAGRAEGEDRDTENER